MQEEETKRKQLEEETKRIQIQEKTKRKQLEEETKRIQARKTGQLTSSLFYFIWSSLLPFLFESKKKVFCRLRYTKSELKNLNGFKTLGKYNICVYKLNSFVFI